MSERIINIVKQLMNSDGVISSIRFMSVLTVVIILSVWSFLSIKNNMMMDIPFGVYTVFVTAIIGKVVQKGIEGKATDSDTNPAIVDVKSSNTEGITN